MSSIVEILIRDGTVTGLPYIANTIVMQNWKTYLMQCNTNDDIITHHIIIFIYLITKSFLITLHID